MAKRILVVDDEDPILFALGSYLTLRGYVVDCAREMEEAEALLAHRPYALVLTDMRLTSVNGAEGLEVASYVRERCPETRIVVLTAYGSPEVEMEAYRLGVARYLHKPIPLPDVARIVSELLERPL